MEKDNSSNENKKAPQENSAPAPEAKSTTHSDSGKTNTMAIVALILTFFFPPLGLILGFVALKQIKQTNEGGKGLALAAVVLSSLWVALIVLAVIMVTIFGVYSNRKTGVSVNTTTGTVTTSKDGGTTQVGENVKIPDGFPSEMPIYPGSNISTASKSNGTDFALASSTKDSFEKVVSYYKSELAAKGWTIDTSYDSSDADGKSTVILASTATLNGSVTISSSKDRTSIVISVYPKSN